ncbi:serine/threonine-protein kinase [Stigmatella aurantiaca]|uniref:Serine/threonine-protein kinase n=3 Tax=Stigmatella aurantiaca TaxID=41 RepID=Q08VM9_STIAD|nr:serine/threonine-protein kinase [Stigmatella aurantiaca]ADO73720.1 Serine/threonine-protein kinase [Stigmatella aurantiaca DW4/3-1]ADO73753.1 Serine/threonine-protein kinase [Stigmatella aurantiaca DW4/3-1]EAU64529.1 serine/threonine-protein kinase Pkn6 [Stigmatella aurantiaca DW4/3-1]
MSTARPPWNIPGVILFSQGELSYEVDLSRGLVEEWAQSKLGERTAVAWERTREQRLRQVIVRSLPATSDEPEALAKARARLREEARLAAHLHHPGIAQIFGIHEVQGALHIVSERVEGASLNTLITYSLMRKAPLTPAFCLYVGAEVASILHYAHSRTDESGAPLGIVHRDVSPTRIYLGTAGEVMLTDFACVRSLLSGRVTTTLPRPQGEVFYASPEALLGEEVDPRSDLFSLGLVLLELATGLHLYNTFTIRPGDLEEALTPAVKEQVLGAAMTALVADLPEHAEDCILRAATFSPQDVAELTEPLPLPLRSILRRVLQRRPEDRHLSAAALEAELRAGLALLEAPYGAMEALEEGRDSRDGASTSRGVIEPTGDDAFPPVLVGEEEITTEPGGTN